MDVDNDGTGLPYGLQPIVVGGGIVTVADGNIRLTRPASSTGSYVNAQIGDVGPLVRTPPVWVRLSARFSHPTAAFHGTAGFGFWNVGMGPLVRLPRPPRAAWFFLSGEEFDVPLVLDVPGTGFKAAVLDAQRMVVYALLPSAPLGFLVMRFPFLYRRLWPLAQRALRAAEWPLTTLDITQWHDYEIVWSRDRVCFRVDEANHLEATGPGWPLEFVAWVDNAYAIATPRGQFAIGAVKTEDRVSLEIRNLQIEYGAGPGGPAP